MLEYKLSRLRLGLAIKKRIKVHLNLKITCKLAALTLLIILLPRSAPASIHAKLKG